MSTKISELSSVSMVGGNAEVPVVQAGLTVKAGLHQIHGLSYSTSEIKTFGRWIDNKPIYQKTVLANPPDGDSAIWVTTNHGISNLETVVSTDAIMIYLAGPSWQPLPKANTSSVANGIQVMVEPTIIKLRSGSDHSSGFTVYVTLWYTKSTDSAIT